MIKELWGKIAFFWFLFILIFVGLFVPEVEASELKNWSLSQTRLTYDDHGTSSFSDWFSTPHTFDNMSLPVKRVGFRLRSSDGLSYENTYNFTFGYLPSPDALSYSRMEWTKNGDSSLQENFTCNNWYLNSNNYYLTDCSFTPSSNYSTSDYLYITIFFNGNGTYLNSIRPYMFGYDERLGTNAVITNSANSIINNENQNTQNIINNNNSNTQAIIDSNMVCTYYDKNSIFKMGYYIASNGVERSYQSDVFGVSDFIPISSKDKLKVLFGYSSSGDNLCFYNVNKENISCILQTTFVVNSYLTIPDNTSYFRFTIAKNVNRPQLELCKNGNSAINDSLNDDSIDDPSDMLSDMEDLLPSNGVITQLIGIPITLYTKILSNINGTCSSQNLGSLYGSNLIIPCIDVSSYLGNTLWTSIDLIISGAFVLIIARKMIKAFENFTSMKDGDVINND